MAGLGLSNAVDSYMQGRDWREKQDIRDRAKAADEAFSGALTQRQSAFDAEQTRLADEAKAAGKAFTPAVFTPGDADYLAAAQARQTKFAQQGDFEGYMKSAAALSPLVTNIRKKALDEYGDDPVALAKALYPTYMDNRELKSADMLDAMSMDGKTQAKRLRLTLSDGSVKFVDPDQVKTQLQRSLMTPEMQLAEAKSLYETKRDAAKAEAEKAKEIAVAANKGELDKALEKLRQEGRLSLADVENLNKLGQIGAQGREARSTKAMPSYSDLNPTGQLLTTPDGNSVLVNPRTGKTLSLRDAATGAPVAATKAGSAAASEDERKAAGWLAQADNAWNNMQAVAFGAPGKDGKPTIKAAASPDWMEQSMWFSETARNVARNPDRQKFVQASSSLSEALLRAATGAGVNESEARQKIAELTPQWGDSDSVIRQKFDSVPMYLQSLKTRAGRAVPRQQNEAVPAGAQHPDDIAAILNRYK